MIPDNIYKDDPLLREAARGSQEAFTALFYQNKDKLYSFLIRLTESPEMTEDVIQDIFLKLWKNRTALTGIENFSSYIFRMAQNQCLTHFKRVARETLALAELGREAAGRQDDPADAEMLARMQARLNTVIAQLPPQQRRVYTLSKHEGLKHEEIARQMAISPATVKNHMVKALGTIREQMAAYGGSGAFLVGFLALIEAFEK